MKAKKKFYWLPKTRLGKISFYVCISAFVIIYLQYGISIIIPNRCDANGCPDPVGVEFLIRVIPGVLAMAIVLITGITSIISIVKYRDRAIVLFVSAFIGLLGLLFVLGEFLIPH
ncbi:MAG: hypothetical protein Q8L34_04285 [Candidatus Woesearchaeota archaeon]|nr:hypothetical protein [Candidatus Woesearchaeota archaeon]